MERNLKYYALTLLTILILLGILNVTLQILGGIKEINKTTSYIYNQLTQAEICEN